MKKIFLPLIGLGAILFAMSLNFRYALNDYGILDNTLSFHITAQASSSGGGSGSGSGSGSGDDSGSSSSDKPKGSKTASKEKDTGRYFYDRDGNKVTIYETCYYCGESDYASDKCDPSQLPTPKC